MFYLFVFRFSLFLSSCLPVYLNDNRPKKTQQKLLPRSRPLRLQILMRYALHTRHAFSESKHPVRKTTWDSLFSCLWNRHRGGLRRRGRPLFPARTLETRVGHLLEAKEEDAAHSADSFSRHSPFSFWSHSCCLSSMYRLVNPSFQKKQHA